MSEDHSHGQWPATAGPAADRKAESARENLMGSGPRTSATSAEQDDVPEATAAGREDGDARTAPEQASTSRTDGPTNTDGTPANTDGTPTPANTDGTPTDTDETPTNTDVTSGSADVTSRRADGGRPASLLEPGHTEEFQRRWETIKASFVDDPRAAVHRADELTDQLIREFTTAIDARRRELTERWQNAGTDEDKTETERLRLALNSYRSMLDPILRL